MGMTQNIELYRIGFSKEFEEALKKPKRPTISIEFNSDDDLFDFVVNHIAFISDEEKSKFTVDINNVVDEELFCKKSVEAYEKHMKSPGD
jgi:hypothetical protein